MKLRFNPFSTKHPPEGARTVVETTLPAGGIHTTSDPKVVPAIFFDLPIVGFTTTVKEPERGDIIYTSSSVQAVSDWLGMTKADIEPVVRYRDAKAEINDLSDLVFALQGSIEQLEQELRDVRRGTGT